LTQDRPVRFEAAAAAEGRQSLFVTVTVKAGKMEAYEKVRETKTHFVWYAVVQHAEAHCVVRASARVPVACQLCAPHFVADSLAYARQLSPHLTHANSSFLATQLIKGHITECFMHDRCMYFDYGFSIDEPNKVFLYETYEVWSWCTGVAVPHAHVPVPISG
jgi:hypothetical protein